MATLIDELPGEWYVCDPEKNLGCPKHMCAGGRYDKGGCAITNQREYAQTDEHGQPVRVHIYRKLRPTVMGWCSFVEGYFVELEGGPGK